MQISKSIFWKSYFAKYIHILLGMFSTRVHKMNSGHLEQREIDDKYIQKTLHRYLVVYRNSDFHIIMLIVSPA